MDRKIRAVVVDDEDLARAQLSGFLKSEPDVDIVGVCGDGRQAIALLKRSIPDVVFLDVQLPDIGGFEVLAALRPEERPLVVFVTAYGQYAARAFEMGVVDYLIKPFDSLRFGVALARVRKELRRGAEDQGRRIVSRMNGTASSAATMTAPSRTHPVRHVGRIMVKDGGRIHFIRVSDIDWIESADNYVRIHAAKEVHLMRHALKHLGACLDAGRFARIHRCTIVNLDRVREIQPGIGRDHIVILEDGTRLKLSPRYRRHLEQQAEPGR